MKKRKNRNSALGVKNNCINFSLCPFCYGCRNYNSSDIRCKECYDDNPKFNICNTKKHKGDIISTFIKKDKITIK